ncbi:ABC-type nitrate/sulfonate/bicarbonate transport system substrate-binding protein [Bradyrhizobium sp. GM6.1]
MDRLKLKAVLGSHPHVQAVKSGELRSNRFDLDFIEYTPTNTAFKPMVREQAFDVCEMAIVTYLMAKAQGKPLVLLPATMLGRFQHSYALYSPAQGTLGPSDLEGKRVGIRSFTTTTGAWIRGILANDYGVNLDKIRLGHVRRPACRRICRHHRARAEAQEDTSDAARRRARRRPW